MPPNSDISNSVNQLRNELQKRREQIRNVHRRGLSGVLVSARLASLTDSMILRLFGAITEGMPAKASASLVSKLAVVALGSFGRRQCAPFSDVDLLLLYKDFSHPQLAEILRPLTQGMFDLGFQLGSSARTIGEAIQLSREDIVICTAHCDARLLLGNQEVFNEFRSAFQKMVNSNSRTLLLDILEARETERNQFGESIYLLEPHVKRSRGGIRDLNVLRWSAFIEFGVSELDALQLMGAISKFDHHRLQSATAFLLSLRNEMHFHAQSQYDVLDRAEQVRIAEWLGYRHSSGLLPVERLMRDYFRHTNHIWQLVRRRHTFLEPPSKVARALTPLLRKNYVGKYIVGPNVISATPAGMAGIKGNLDEVLELATLSASTSKPIDQALFSLISMSAPEISEQIPARVRASFYDCLGNVGVVASTLTLLQELGVLEKLVPAMQHARFLLQFNQYHKFTVDEHCLKSVYEATRLSQQSGVLGNVYGEIRDKRILHMALLLHDLGKGMEEDHSEEGKRIAEETAELFELDEETTSDLVFLVHRHLSMSHLAFRRDTSDHALMKAFAGETDNAERLRMLFIHTCADIAAVGPGVLNAWKVEVLTDVYLRTLKILEPEKPSALVSEIAMNRETIVARLIEQFKPEEGDLAWCQRQLDLLPNSLLAVRSSSEIANILGAFKRLGPSQVVAWCTFHPESGTIECIAGANHGVGKGLFAKMAGVLSGENLQIVSASTDVLADEFLMLRYTAIPPTNLSPVSDSFLSAISAKLGRTNETADPPRFRRIWGQERQEAARRLSSLPDRVRIHNSQSETFTILEVFTFDRPGLLYRLARKIHELELVIRHAKISTHLDQVVDVFYLSDRNGHKVTDEDALHRLQEHVRDVIM